MKPNQEGVWKTVASLDDFETWSIRKYGCSQGQFWGLTALDEYPVKNLMIVVLTLPTSLGRRQNVKLHNSWGFSLMHLEKKVVFNGLQMFTDDAINLDCEK